MIKHFFIFLMTICNFNSKESISHLIEKNNLKINLNSAYSSNNPFKNIDQFVVFACMPVQKSMLQKMNRLFEQKLGSYGTVQLYPTRPQTWNLDCAKAPGFDDRKWVNIRNMNPFAIVESRELSRGSKSKFEAEWGIKSMIVQNNGKEAFDLSGFDAPNLSFEIENVVSIDGKELNIVKASLSLSTSVLIKKNQDEISPSIWSCECYLKGNLEKAPEKLISASLDCLLTHFSDYYFTVNEKKPTFNFYPM